MCFVMQPWVEPCAPRRRRHRKKSPAKRGQYISIDRAIEIAHENGQTISRETLRRKCRKGIVPAKKDEKGTWYLNFSQMLESEDFSVDVDALL